MLDRQIFHSSVFPEFVPPPETGSNKVQILCSRIFQVSLLFCSVSYDFLLLLHFYTIFCTYIKKKPQLLFFVLKGLKNANPVRGDSLIVIVFYAQAISTTPLCS